MKTQLASLLGLALLSACSTLEPIEATSTAAIAAEASAEKLEAEQESVRHLTRINIDAHALYGDALLMARNVKLKNELRLLIDRRQRFAGALQQRSTELGDTPAEHGEASGTLRRTTARMSSFVRNDSLTAAQEAYRSESHLIDQFERALQSPLTETTKTLIEKELLVTRASRRRINDIRAEIQSQIDAN